jgi:oligosaccharide repeat unit polymerase
MSDDTTNHLSIAASLLMAGIFFMCAGSRDHRLIRIIALSVGLAFIAVNFLVGTRSTAMDIVLGLPLVWNYAIKRIPRAAIGIACAIVGGVILPVVSITRVATEPTSIGDISTALGNPVVALFSEAGFSMAASGITYEMVPKQREFDLGRSYAYSLTSLIPGQKAKDLLANDRSYLADWMVEKADPVLASVGGGLGYSFIAEAYFNFGWFGLVIVPAIVGYAVAWAARIGRLSAYPGVVAVVGCLAGPIVFLCRGESMGFVQFVGWYVIAPFALVIGIGYIGRVRLRLQGQIELPSQSLT